MTRRPKKLFRQESSKSPRKSSPPPKSPPKSQSKPAKKKPSGNRREEDDDDTGGLRLQKVMAAAGIGSRRHCEEMILEGRVEVDGRTVKKLGTKVEPTEQEIRVDGEVLKPPRMQVYYLVNKPDGVVSTNSDPAGRTRVIDLVPQHEREHRRTDAASRDRQTPRRRATGRRGRALRERARSQGLAE
jgi:ribosomal 50S subunit-recycling heat shock protein